MLSSAIPTKIPLPFAYNAGAGYINTIPTASQIGITNGKASLADGFPPLTFTAISAGGIPPFGADVNGILNEVTAITQWQQAGGFFVYDSAFSTTISGYPKGAILQSANRAGLWVSTAENNTTNPDTGGAGWTSLAFEGSQAITVTTADVTVTQLQSAYPVLIISGALTAARSLILPAIVGEWIIQNNTTGAFSLTVKTLAGTGVSLTQTQSTFIYGDGTNILFADSSKVASFNGRVGVVTLNATDVTTALGYVPVQPNGTGATGTWGISISGDWTSLPSGTVTDFFQAAAPTGWTQITTYANHMMRVVSGTGGGSGGSDSPIVNSTTMVAHTHTFTGTALAAHTHTDSGHTHSSPTSFNGFQVNYANGGAVGGGVTGIGYAVLSSNSAGTPTGSNSTTTGVSWLPKYIDMIICAKN